MRKKLLLLVSVVEVWWSSGTGLVNLVLERGGARPVVVNVGERSVAGSWWWRYVVVARGSICVSERDVCADRGERLSKRWVERSWTVSDRSPVLRLT